MIRIPSSGQFFEEVERRRPKGTPRASTKAVAEAAREFAVLAAPVFEDVLDDDWDDGVDGDDGEFEDRVVSNADTVMVVCVDLALMAEDLLSGGFLWRVIEENNRRLFGSPLPLVVPVRAGVAGGVGAAADALPALDGGEGALDERRFRFFLFTTYSCWAPDIHAFPDEAVFVDLAGMAARFFRRLRGKAVSPGVYLSEPDNAHDAIGGLGVKRKLVWLGGASYLFAGAFWDHMAESGEVREARESAMDDFLCETCTQWSGLGALEVLADALRLEGQDRADLLGWSERHVSMFRVESVLEFAHPGAPGVPAVLLSATNLASDESYEVPMFKVTPQECPFRAGEYVFGMMVRWRGVWRWSGAQKKFDPADLPDMTEFWRAFFMKSSQLAYRFRPDLLAKAQETEARMRVDFLRFHGDELKVQPDGPTMVASEERRWREMMAGERLRSGTGAGAGVELPDAQLPERMAKSTRPVAVFYTAGDGVCMMGHFDAVRSGLRKAAYEELSVEECAAVSDFVEGLGISPEFVRRAARDEGNDGIVAYYCGDARMFDAAAREMAVEYLLRRFKGEDFRRRFPKVSVMPEEMAEE